MQRVLDLDLDFFVRGTAYWRPDNAGRLDSRDYPPWDVEDVVAFLEERCMLTGRLPGFVVDSHGEIFARWRDAISAGVLRPPFHVTHVDAHADLGLGEAGWVYLMSELLFRPVDERSSPRMGSDGLTDGSWLSFAVACRWLADLVYVFNDEGPRPSDLHPHLMEDGDTRASSIQLAAVAEGDIELVDSPGWTRTIPQHLEPKVPFLAVPWERFCADQAFDVICLARSPSFTPAESDVAFDVIRDLFIDEIEG